MTAPAAPPSQPADKSQLTGGRQYHVGVERGEVHDVVLMPGDPFRVALVAEQLDDVVEVAHQREYRTVNGTFRGMPITVCSSGMGCPSTAIGVEELANAGATTFIRVGSTGALQPGMAIGDLVVSEGTLRNDGTTAQYVPLSYPAVPDLRLTVALEDASRALGERHGFGVHVGLNASDDAFWAETPEHLAGLTRLGILNVEMESSAMFVVARRRGLRAGMVCAVSANLATGDVVYGRPNERLHVGWVHSVTAALEAVHGLWG